MKHLKSSKGQMTVEAVLLMTIMVAGFLAVQKAFKGNDYLAKVVNGPWSLVQGMVENGVWASADAGRAKHPNNYARRASPEPM